MSLKQFVLLFCCAIFITDSIFSENYLKKEQPALKQQNSAVIDTITIAKWLNNATSAFTFTWDDNNYSHQQVGQILESYGFKGSFFVNPGFANWDNIKAMYAQLSENGHEIGNHTWSHLNLTTLQMESLLFQVNAPINEILDVTGVYPVSFVQPFNASNPTVDSVVFINHLFARIRSHYPMQNRMRRDPLSHHNLTHFGNWINESIQSNKWLIIGAHGIDGAGWEPITSELLHQVCQILETNQPDIWVGTMKEIAAYEYLKEELSINYIVENTTLIVDFEGFDAEKYTHLDSLPFTILIDLEECNRLVNEENTAITIALQPTASPWLKQYAVTFDLKTKQSFSLEIKSEPLVFNLLGENGYCTGGSGVALTLDGSETGIYYYLIYNDADTIAFLIGNDEALNFVNITEEGNYKVIAKDPVTGCRSYMHNIATVNEFPLPYLSIPENFEVCEGEEVTLFAEYNHGTLYWSNDVENGVPFIPDQTQTFAAVVISDYGCIPALGSVMITVNPLPFLQIPLGFDVCEGDTIVLNSLYYHGSLSWSSGILNNEPFPIYESGFYSATVTSYHGCGEISDTVFVTVNPLPDVFLIDFDDLCKGDYNFTLTGGTPLGGIYYIDGVEVIDIIPLNAGEYQIGYEYIDMNGCRDMAFSNLIVLECTTTSDKISEMIRIYPNPTQDILNIEVPFKASAVLINLSGESVADLNLNSGVNTLYLSEMKKGVYFLTLMWDDQLWNTKIIKR